MDQDQNTKPAEQPFPAAPMSEKSNLSMLVGVGAFIIVLAGLGWYFIQGGGVTTDSPALPTPAQSASTAPAATTTADSAAAALSTQSSSDAPQDINSDLNATDLNSLNDIDKI